MQQDAKIQNYKYLLGTPIVISLWPFKDWISSKYYIKIQFVPRRKHITSPLQRPNSV
jgi:hypothetical protein